MNSILAMSDETGAALVGFLLIALLFLIASAAYFLPSLIAFARSHRNAPSVFIVNLVFGWTVLGWIGAFLWAIHQDKRA